jgi:hypothetical protein
MRKRALGWKGNIMRGTDGCWLLVGSFIRAAYCEVVVLAGAASCVL